MPRSVGDEATAMSDEDVLRLRDRLEALAHVLLVSVDGVETGSGSELR